MRTFTVNYLDENVVQSEYNIDYFYIINEKRLD